MKNEAIKQYYIVNGSLKPISDYQPFQKVQEPIIYEVIRVIEGVPLFLEDHLERMRKSAELLNIRIHREDEEIETDIRRLIKENREENLNVKLLYSNGGESPLLFAYFIKSFYPPEEYYKEGIHTILYKHERENPNAKVQQSSFREKLIGN